MRLLKAQITGTQPKTFIAGPAFNAGRFGYRLADICKDGRADDARRSNQGLYEENPEVEMYRKDYIILKVGQ